MVIRTHRSAVDSAQAVTAHQDDARTESHPTRGCQHLPGTATRYQRVNLCGEDYAGRRRHLFLALRSLAPGEELQVVSDNADDLSWLRHEMEQRLSEGYIWTPSQENRGTACATVGLLPPPPRCDCSASDTSHEAS